MYKFNFYLDKTFKKGVSEQDVLALKELSKEGKSIKKYLNDSPTSIYVGATIHGIYFKVRTEEKVLPSYWDSATQSVKPNHPNAFEFNADLQALKAKIDLAYRNARANNLNLSISDTKDLIKKVIHGNMVKPITQGFFGLWEEFIEEKKKTTKASTLERYNTTKTRLLLFQDN